jgi:hypothetical protein
MQTSHGIWAVAHSKILTVQIINSIDFPAITGVPSRPTAIDAPTYAAQGLPFSELYRDKPTSAISGAFGDIKTVSPIEQESSFKFGKYPASDQARHGVTSFA